MTIDNIVCKSCGASIDPKSAMGGVVACEYCGNKYTLPKSDSAAEAIVRQGALELEACDFDKAYAAFKRASELDNTEPEAYWGMALAEFKVQFLKDERNNHLQPICFDVSGRMFSDSANYKKAIALATPDQREEYEKKAAEIDYIRKEFYAQKSKGVSYDCFICVKVTDDATGKKTEDRDRASDLYEHLFDMGYKPFYSERVLKHETGAEYEARILYALMSAGSMIVVCSNEEYLRTPWVKNEYTRFLRLIGAESKDRDAITVAFCGAPVDRLPGRDKSIQGVDLSRPDAYNRLDDFVSSHIKVEKVELVRKEYGNQNFKKKDVIKSQVQKRTLATYAKTDITVSEQRQLDFARDILSKGNFLPTVNQCNNIINSNPSCSEAYWLRFLAENECVSVHAFETTRRHISSFADFESAISTADGEQSVTYYDALYNRVNAEKSMYLYKEYISLPDSTDENIAELTMKLFKLVKDYYNFEEARNIFDEIIKTVTDANRYIAMNIGFADKWFERGENVKKYYEAVLDADASNYEAQYKYFILDKGLNSDESLSKYCFNSAHQSEIENSLFSYGFNVFAIRKFAELCMKYVAKNATAASDFFAYITTLVPTNGNDYLINILGKFTWELICAGKFDLAQRFNEQLPTIDAVNRDAYFNRVLINKRYKTPLYLINDCENLYNDQDFMNAVNADLANGTNVFPTLVEKLKGTRDYLLLRKISVEKYAGRRIESGVENLLKALKDIVREIDQCVSESNAKKVEKSAKKEGATKKGAVLYAVLAVVLGAAGTVPSVLMVATGAIGFKRIIIAVISIGIGVGAIICYAKWIKRITKIPGKSKIFIIIGYTYVFATLIFGAAVMGVVSIALYLAG